MTENICLDFSSVIYTLLDLVVGLVMKL